ncbi:MAG: hypothetical protein Q4C54_06190 [Clostridia bacterium]|nr:hypothetical protein [Clostridia bacterium]
MKRWIAFQKRFNQVLPTIPVYSNIYQDIHIVGLKNYRITAQTNWPAALLYANVEQSASQTPAMN